MKKYLFIVATALAGLASYFYLNQNPIAVKLPQTNAVIALEQEQQAAANSVAHSSSSANTTGAWGRKLTATEMALKSEWMERTGRAPENKEAYEHYSDSQLTELVNKGDIYAMAVMGTRKLANPESAPDAAIPYAEKAIVYGSLSGISSMANYTAPNALDDGKPYEEIKKKFMESQAYYALYAMRGDPYSAKLFKETQLDLFKEKYKLDKVFDAVDEAWITNRAQELYNQYQAERNKLGLGDFDNEMPQEVKNFFDPKKE